MPAAAKQYATINGHEIAFSNVDKVLWPRDGYTKGDLLAYYAQVAPLLLPHLQDRPLTLQRWPDGIDAESFFEKQAPRFTPSWIERFAASAYENKRTIHYILCNDEAALLWCVNLATIVLHVWYSRAQSPERPDYALFDLDVGDTCTLRTLCSVALAFREALGEIGVQPLVKTSGGSGLHVIVPLEPRYDYDTVKTFAEVLARHIATMQPERTTLERSIARRPEDRVYLDYVQVGRGKTVVPPYSARARDGAPVSMPLAWDEIETLAKKRGLPATAFAKWTIRTAPERVRGLGDLWDSSRWKRATLETVLRKAQKIWHDPKI